jgi:uncharacterized protein (DUF302 family)
MAADGLTTLPSSHGPKDTMDRLEAEVKAKGMTVFARIDHAAEAAQVGLALVSRFRSSLNLAAHSHANFGIEGH